MEKVYQYRTKVFGTQHSPIFFAQAFAMVLTKILKELDLRILNYVDDLFLPHQNKKRFQEQILIIMEILEAIVWTLAQEKCEIEPKQHINFLEWTWDLKRMYIKMTDLRKQELRFQLRKFIILTERHAPIKIKYLASIVDNLNFFKSPSKRSFPLLKANGLSKDESIEEQRMEREYDSTQGNPSRALLEAGSDSEELGDDTRSEDFRGSYGIRRISEWLGSDSGTINRRYFSPTWKMEQRTEEVDKQQEGDGSYILRTIPLRINLQRAENQGDPHQVRQLYSRIRFSKAMSRINSSSRSEENSQAMSTTENTNTDSTYSGNLKQHNRLTKQTKHPGRLFSKERDIYSPVLSVVDNTNTGLFAIRENKLVDRYVAIGEEEKGAEWLNTFSRLRKEEIFWIPPPFPNFGKALIAQEKFKPKSIMIASWWPGQIWFMHLLTGSSRYIILEESSLILNPGKEMMKWKDMLPP
ncbi:MAG: hypothetical protein EZS28_008438 [Streblomastix strix]|uniref:Reverse transcriptase domain-containing protein n=1 Tax=Streblomastix strix TaxID=222440 RepID=A0A5J4WMZ7_9EUKA|nr:MAG: hypothetical protein EZS28_008438 [Streblomastix strix]